MLSKPYLPNHLQNLTYEENLTKHYKKLGQIQGEDRKKRNVDKEVAEKVKFAESREKNIKFHIHEKTQAIEKDNELLLGRLVSISRKKPAVLNQTKSENTLPRTLNGPSRRREKDRIAAENEAFARRLLSQQPSFNPKKFESDYEKHQQRVKGMAKLAMFSPRKVKLPPIKYADDVIREKEARKQEKAALKLEKNLEKKKKNVAKTEGDEEVAEHVPQQENESHKAGPIKNKDSNIIENTKVKSIENIPKETDDKPKQPVQEPQQNKVDTTTQQQPKAENGVQSTAQSQVKIDTTEQQHKAKDIPQEQPKAKDIPQEQPKAKDMPQEQPKVENVAQKQTKVEDASPGQSKVEPQSSQSKLEASPQEQPKTGTIQQSQVQGGSSSALPKSEQNMKENNGVQNPNSANLSSPNTAK